MIDITYNAVEPTYSERVPLIDGVYDLRFVGAKEWQKVEKKNVKVYKKEGDNNFIFNEKGERETEIIPKLTYYTCSLRFEVLNKVDIVDGKEVYNDIYKGNYVFFTLSTHPNCDYLIGNFVSSLGLDSLNLNNIDDNKGKEIRANVVVETYETTKQDKDTGIEYQEEKTAYKIKNFVKKKTLDLELDI